MKKHLNKLILSAVLGFAVSAHAVHIEYRDADLLNQIIGAGSSYSDSFDIVNPDGTASFTVQMGVYSTTTQHGGTTFTSALGYTPGDPIVDGTVSFWFRAASGDTVEVTVGLETILSSTGSGNVIFLSESLGATLIADIETDGTVSYTVLNVGPTPIRLDYALLVAIIDDQQVPVPEGGTTAMLLGLGLVGLAGIRKFRK
jgi:hypothetical protein